MAGVSREYYSIPEAAARLGLSRIAVFKKVKKGQLQALRIGRNWAVPASALEKTAAARKEPGIFAPPLRTGERARRRKVVLPPKKEVPPPSSPDTEMDSMGWD